jgi:hypothetical protein
MTDCEWQMRSAKEGTNEWMKLRIFQKKEEM